MSYGALAGETRAQQPAGSAGFGRAWGVAVALMAASALFAVVTFDPQHSSVLLPALRDGERFVRCVFWRGRGRMLVTTPFGAGGARCRGGTADGKADIVRAQYGARGRVGNGELCQQRCVRGGAQGTTAGKGAIPGHDGFCP